METAPFYILGTLSGVGVIRLSQDNSDIVIFKDDGIRAYLYASDETVIFVSNYGQLAKLDLMQKRVVLLKGTVGFKPNRLLALSDGSMILIGPAIGRCSIFNFDPETLECIAHYTHLVLNSDGSSKLCKQTVKPEGKIYPFFNYQNMDDITPLIGKRFYFPQSVAVVSKTDQLILPYGSGRLGTGIRIIDLSLKTFHSKKIYSGEGQNLGSFKFAAISKDGAFCLIDKAFGSIDREQPSFSAENDQTKRRWFGRSKVSKPKIRKSVEYWQLLPEIKHQGQVLVEEFENPEDADFKPYKHDGFDPIVCNYFWPKFAALPFVLLRSGQLRQLAIGKLGPSKTVEGTGSQKLFQGKHTRSGIEVESGRLTVASLARGTSVWTTLEGYHQFDFDTDKPIKLFCQFTAEEIKAQKKQAMLLAERARGGWAEIKSMRTEDMLEGISELTRMLRHRGEEISHNGAWNATLFAGNQRLDEVDWARHLSCTGDQSAIPILDDFLDAVMRTGVKVNEDVPSSPLEGQAYWELYLTRESTPKLGASTANALIRLLNRVPERVLTFYRHNDISHDYFTQGEGLNVDVSPYLRPDAQGALNFYAIIGWQMMVEGLTDPEIFIRSGSLDLQAELSKGFVDPHAAATIFGQELKNIFGNNPNNDLKEFALSAFNGLNLTDPWQEKFGKFLLAEV